MSRYAQGRRYEYKTMKVLEEQGYSVVRSASSKGLWDVTAISADHTKLIQVKSTRTKKGTSYRDKNLRMFEALPVPPGTLKEVWVYRVGIGAPEIVQLGETNA